jgi:hypothetical protein
LPAQGCDRQPASRKHVQLAASAPARRLVGPSPIASQMEMSVAIKGREVGKMRIALFTHSSPLAAENFRQLCTGEKGMVPAGHPGAGSKYHLEGTTFYRECATVC